jgi:GNAT superfamily N-acetyltransferase
MMQIKPIEYLREDDGKVSSYSISGLPGKIKALCKAIRENEESLSVLNKSIIELETLVLPGPVNGQSASNCLAEIANEDRGCLNDAYCRWETDIEYKYAQAVLSGKEAGISNYLLCDRFNGLVRRELALIEAPIPCKMLFIGSGPFPISAIHLSNFTGGMVDCLDRDPEAVKVSRRVIKELGFSETIRVFNGTGESFNAKDYDLILIALLAKPKRRILRNLRKRVGADCRVLCRTSFGLRTLIYDPTPEESLQGFHVVAKQVADGDQTISTFLLESIAGNAHRVQLRWIDEIDERVGAGLLRVMNRVLEKETTIGFPGPLDLEAGNRLIADLDADVRACRRYVLIAERDGIVLGQTILTPHHLPNCKHLIELSRGIIDPLFRGAGLAQRAFQEIVRKCEEVGCEVICLDVRAGTMAAELWRSFGFVPFGVLKDYARVSGYVYKGLYMSQAVSDLKHRLEQMASGRKTDTSKGAPAGSGVSLSFRPFGHRAVQPLGILEHNGWKMKLYAIAANGATVSVAFADCAEAATRRVLPDPAFALPARYGVGFVVIHAGVDSDVVVVCWWGEQDELFLRVFTSPPDRPELLTERSNTNSSIACVWDLEVIWHERQAWISHVLRTGEPDFTGYLADTLQG